MTDGKEQNGRDPSVERVALDLVLHEASAGFGQSKV